jgi:hypothetical protein
MGKSPATQFYWGDWRRDPGIRACTFETRGIWFEMLCVMWECEPRGYFNTNNNGLDDISTEISTAARMIGCTEKEYKNAVTELEKYHVLSRDSHGIIFNRRMAREAKMRKDWSIRQARHRKNVTQESQLSHAKVTPLSSSSSSRNNNKGETKIDVTPNVTPPRYYKNEAGNFICSQCQKSFMQWKNLQSHFEEHKEGKV